MPSLTGIIKVKKGDDIKTMTIQDWIDYYKTITWVDIDSLKSAYKYLLRNPMINKHYRVDFEIHVYALEQAESETK